MKNKILIALIGALIGALIALIGALLAFSPFLMGHLGSTPAHPLGATVIGNEFLATSTNAQATFANYVVIRGKMGRSATGTPTTLGTITITTTGTAPMCFYDATSTVTNAEWATTTIACFPASATVGTYSFDSQLNKGILVEFSDGAGKSRASSTITYR